MADAIPADLLGGIGPGLAAFGLLTIFSSALGVARGEDIERALAHAAVGAGGWLVLGIAAAGGADPQGTGLEGNEPLAGPRGIALLAASLGLSAAALAFLADVVAERRGSRRIRAGADLPLLSRRLAVSLWAAGFAIVGVPPSGAFFGKLAAIRNVFGWHPILAVAALGGFAFETFAIVRLLVRSHAGPEGRGGAMASGAPGPETRGIADLDGLETTAVAGLLGLVILMGIVASLTAGPAGGGSPAGGPLPLFAPVGASGAR
jgi:formate hydrogenlyase subunit 3/multisubunit Na+/H+ antiporter MnhD subunit